MLTRRHTVRLALFSAPLLLLAAPAHRTAAQADGKPDLGLFEGSTDIGQTRPGATIYDPASGAYRVTGGGADLWGTADQFHFTWVELKGDASLEADITFPPDDVVPKEKAILIFRQSLDPESAYADVALHGDGHIAAQWRKTFGGPTEDATAEQHGSRHLKIVRRGDVFLAYAGPSGADLQQAASPATVKLKGTVYVGLGVCSHNADGVNVAVFSHVKLERGK